MRTRLDRTNRPEEVIQELEEKHRPWTKHNNEQKLAVPNRKQTHAEEQHRTNTRPEIPYDQRMAIKYILLV